MKRQPIAYIFANGQMDDPVGPNIAPISGDLLIAADGGAKWCFHMGYTPDVVIGDLDSIDRADLERLKCGGVEIQGFPTDKDQTDLELALSLARARGCARAFIIGALGGRTDMMLANIFLLFTPPARQLTTTIIEANQHIHCLTSGHRLTIQGHPGDGLSLLPIGGDARGITTQGVAYPLTDATLPAGTSRGVSNVLTHLQAHLSLAAGALLVIHRFQSQSGLVID